MQFTNVLFLNCQTTVKSTLRTIKQFLKHYLILNTHTNMFLRHLLWNKFLKKIIYRLVNSSSSCFKLFLKILILSF